ncbi:Atrazine chlorohydrolase [Schaedlerella arabinosiphila]|nr:Atrazine chlorohydrolase [Schaedlerella arabinosiphila]
MENKLDILFLHAIVITMRGNGVGIIEDGAVGVKGTRITFVGSSEEASGYVAERLIDAANHKVIMPGLIDAHIHSGDGLIRGTAQDLNHWMQHGIWPFEQALRQDEDAVIKGSLMNIMEALKAGTTTFCDFDTPMTKIVENHVKLGTRARVTELISELPKENKTAIGELYEFDPAEGNAKFERCKKLFERWHGQENGRITCMFGPQGADMLSKELLLEIKSAADHRKTGIHMHVSQGDREIDQMIKRYGMRTIPFLEEVGYLDEQLMAVHLTEATEEETRFLAGRGAGMVLCSGSIAIIDGIVPPAAAFLEVSGRLALGSDQAPGNNCNNMFNEMKFTAILNKCKSGNPSIFPAWKVLRMATIEAARAIGLGEETGSIEVGKKADIIMVDFTQPCLAPIIHYPVRNIVPNLVYSAKGSEVEMVLVDGKVLIDGFKVVSVDEGKVVRDAQEAAFRVAKAAEGPFSRIPDTPLREMMENGEL